MSNGSPWGPPQPDGELSHRGLDRQSRQAVRWLLLRLWSVALIALLGTYLENKPSARAFAGLISLTCAIGAMVCAVVAALHREAFARGSLNTWDEALAFVALSRLAHVALGLQA